MSTGRKEEIHHEEHEEHEDWKEEKTKTGLMRIESKNSFLCITFVSFVPFVVSLS